MDLSIFSCVPFSVELVPPKQTLIGIGLMVTLAVRAFERMGAWFTFLGFQSRRVNFVICLTTPTEFSMVFGFMGAVTFDALGILDSAQKGCVFLFPAVFALGDAGIHICSLNGRDIVANIKTSVD